MDNVFSPDVKSIKEWLTRQGYNRTWLASRLDVKKSTIDNWLSRGKPIPQRKLAALARLMAAPPEVKYSDVIAVAVRFTPEEMEALLANLPEGSDLETVLRNKLLTDVVPAARRDIAAATGCVPAGTWEPGGGDLAAAEAEK